MWKNATLFLFACLASVALVEGILRVTFDIRGMTYLGDQKISDPVLKHRLPAESYGHDKNGLRNPKVPDSVDILAVGDSMTYGVMAAANESWPAHLSVLTDKSVYNAGLGGYGPLQYLHMVRTLTPTLKPEQIIVMVYVVNDMQNAYGVAYKLEHWKDYRIDGASPPKTLRREPVPKEPFGEIRDWLRHNTIFYSLIREMVFELGLNPDLRSNPYLRVAHLGRTFALPESQWKGWGWENLNEGSRITKRALGEIATYCAERDIDLHVALMPTRAYVLYPFVSDQLNASQDAAMKRLVQKWEVVISELTDFLSSEDIPYTNLYDPMVRAFETQLIYPAGNHHPNGEGYRVVAEVLAETIN